MPACFESASNVFECATEVELDKVLNMQIPVGNSKTYFNQSGKILEAKEISNCNEGCVGVIPSK